MAPMEISEARHPQAAWRRGFWALIVTQFQGAFSDNALRFLVTFMGLQLGLWTGHRETFV